MDIRQFTEEFPGMFQFFIVFTARRAALKMSVNPILLI